MVNNSRAFSPIKLNMIVPKLQTSIIVRRLAVAAASRRAGRGDVIIGQSFIIALQDAAGKSGAFFT